MHAWRLRNLSGSLLVVLALDAGVATAASPADDPLSALQQTVNHVAAPSPVMKTPSPKAPRDAELENSLSRAIDYLCAWQHQNGSWDRLENNQAYSHLTPDGLANELRFPLEDSRTKDLSEPGLNEEVADTCLATEALFLAATTDRRADGSARCLKALDYLYSQIKKWDGNTIYIQGRTFDPVHDTTPVRTPGCMRYYDRVVDTFFALRTLTDIRGKVTDLERRARLDAAIQMLIDKVVDNQSTDGTWPDEADPLTRLPFQAKVDDHSVIQPARQVNEHYPHIVTHCFALGVVEHAAAAGLPIPLSTRTKAENYLTKAMPNGADSLGTSVEFQPMLALVFVSTRYELDVASRARLEAAKKANPVDERRVAALADEAVLARKQLGAAFAAAPGMTDGTLRGPAMDAIPNYLATVRLLHPRRMEVTGRNLRRALLAMQNEDGHFKSDPIRGDSTFGTSNSVRALIALADSPVSSESVEGEEANPASTSPVAPPSVDTSEKPLSPPIPTTEP